MNFLISLGYGVEVASTGREGLAKLKENLVDMVLLDVKLPDIEGPQLLMEIRALYPTLKVMMVTGSVDDKLMAETKALGASGYFTKPFNLVELAQALEKNLK